MDISSRFPKWSEIAQIYAVIVMMVYSWTIILFSYRLPGWLYTLSLGEIFNVFTYSISVDFFESLVVLMGIVFLDVLLPRKLFGNVFVSSGSAFSILTLGLMMYIASRFGTKQDYPSQLIRLVPLIMAGIVLVAFAFGHIKVLRHIMEWFTDRVTIFLYISIPVSVVCLFFVLVQIVF